MNSELGTHSQEVHMDTKSVSINEPAPITFRLDKSSVTLSRKATSSVRIRIDTISLTFRELEIAVEAKERAPKEIAEKLGISVRTVTNIIDTLNKEDKISVLTTGISLNAQLGLHELDNIISLRGIAAIAEEMKSKGDIQNTFVVYKHIPTTLDTV